MKIIFLQTGGTIDKDYKANKKNHGYNFEIHKPAVKFILHALKPKFKYKILTVCKKDSLYLTDNDRQRILHQCQKIKAKKIIITHGTDTFKKTAEQLSQITDKAIILTGAMVPARFVDTDAIFNIGVAIGAINNIKNGVYISIGGITYPWDDYNP
ncbi:asparaginase [Patescibacteria group bacterium]|nr:asparaginase [Patescibacteria group bacterium]